MVLNLGVVWGVWRVAEGLGERFIFFLYMRWTAAEDVNRSSQSLHSFGEGRVCVEAPALCCPAALRSTFAQRGNEESW